MHWITWRATSVSPWHMDRPYAREFGYVAEAQIAPWDGMIEGHDVPHDVLNNIVHFLLQGGHQPDALINFSDSLREKVLEGAKWCCNDGCEVVGERKEFKVCPQCKTMRYCGDECQKQDWNAGGHKTKCGTYMCFNDNWFSKQQ